MKILDVINEAALDALTAAGLETVGPTSGTPEQVREIQDALRRHTLVLGLNGDGTFRRGGPAWSGPTDGEWTPALSDAVVAWHRSIAIQRRPGEIVSSSNFSNTIGRNDIQPLLYDTLTPEGLLVFNGGETQPNGRPNLSQGAGTGFTYNMGPLTHHDPETITTGQQFMDAIGFTGFWDIKYELLRLAEGTDEEIDISPAEMRREGNRFIQQVFDNLQTFPNTWVTHWRTEILASQRREVATLADGTQMPLNPPSEATRSWSTLYEYFYRLASGLHTKFNRQERDRASDAQETAADPNEATLSESEISIRATRLAQALENDWLAFIPGGRDVSNDAESVKEIFDGLRSAGDYNQLSLIFARQQNESLEERLVSEFDNDEQYNQIVRSNLARIRRIAPRMYHAAIQWPGTDENITVQVEGIPYTVERAPENGRIVVKRGSTVVRDAILEDTILKEAVRITGGTTPDLNVRPDDAAIQHASAAFVTAIEDTYPEMVAWYAYQDPFNSRPNTPDIGGLRMRGIVVEGGRLHTAGMSDQDLINWIVSEIENDHLWLIGDGTEENEGAANIVFDRRYASEGLGRNRNIPTNDLDSEVELSDQEESILNRLRTNNESETNSAISDLIALPDVPASYESIYRRYVAMTGNGLDKALADENSFGRILNGENDTSPLARIINEGRVPVPIAAPQYMAEAFAEAMTGLFGWGWTGTDDDLMEKLVNLITSRHDYALINERYQSLDGTDDDLLDDIAGEELFNTWYNRLASIIGEQAAEISSEHLPETVRRALIDAVENPSAETLQVLDRNLDTRTVTNMEYAAYRTVVLNLQKIGEAVESGDLVLDDEAMEYVEEILNRLIPIANEKYEGTWGDFFNPNWFRWVTFQGDTPGWFND